MLGGCRYNLGGSVSCLHTEFRDILSPDPLNPQDRDGLRPDRRGSADGQELPERPRIARTAMRTIATRNSPNPRIW